MKLSLLVLLLFIAGVIIYTAYRIRRLQRLSEQQWREVDQSKLRDWHDDED